MKTIEQLVWEKKFPNEPFNADNYYDWVRENSNEAFNILSEVTKSFSDLLEACEKLLVDFIYALSNQGKVLGLSNEKIFEQIEKHPLIISSRNAINKATK
jgi:hypothetical protein